MQVDCWVGSADEVRKTRGAETGAEIPDPLHPILFSHHVADALEVGGHGGHGNFAANP